MSASRDKVQVVFLESTSYSPACNLVKRSFADTGKYSTLSSPPLPKIAAATARQTSTSIPDQLPFSSGFEKPGSP